jgi:hypothetical protein
MHLQTHRPMRFQYHLWYTGKTKDKTIESSWMSIAPMRITFDHVEFELKTEMREMTEDGNFVIHYNCFQV